MLEGVILEEQSDDGLVRYVLEPEHNINGLHHYG